MVPEPSILIALVQLVDRLPLPPAAPRRGRPAVYSDHLFLKALVIMIVKHLPQVHTLLAVLEQPTPEMQRLRALLTEHGRYPTRRTWERRLRALPPTLPAQIGFLLGDTSYDDAALRDQCAAVGYSLVTSKRGGYPHTDDGVEVRRLFHQLRSHSIENFNEQFKALFDTHGQVPTRGLVATQRWGLGAVFVYQLLLLYRHLLGADLRVGLKPFLKAA